jgi:hypothetical protein
LVQSVQFRPIRPNSPTRPMYLAHSVIRILKIK